MNCIFFPSHRLDYAERRGAPRRPWRAEAEVENRDGWQLGEHALYRRPFLRPTSSAVARGRRRRMRAFTLAEVLIAMAVSAFMFAATLTTVITLQRSYASTMDYSRGTIDQQRVLDYIARDLRRALTVTVSTSSQTLTVTAPDTYSAYDAQGNPTGAVVTPTITSGKVNYGDPTKPLTICYYISGNQMLRQQTIGATGAVSTTVIADSVELLQSSYQDLTSVVTYSVTFAPDITIYDRNSSQARLSTTLTGCTSVRNERRD